MARFTQGITLKALLENPDILNPPKAGLDSSFTNDKLGAKPSDSKLTGDGHYNQSAFLGPNIWGKNPSVGAEQTEDDINFEYMDLDEFLCENGIPVNDMLFGDNFLKSVTEGTTGPDDNKPSAESPSQLQQMLSGKELSPEPRKNPPITSPTVNVPPVEVVPPAPPTSTVVPQTGIIPNSPEVAEEPQNMVVPPAGKPNVNVKVDFKVSPTDIQLANVPGREDFNPAACAFSEDELRPQPMIKKARKIFVNEELKDEKYWARRNKNNIAAKRSRDARRIKENQITLRAAFLEKQNTQLISELELAIEENKQLKAKLAKYEGALSE